MKLPVRDLIHDFSAYVPGKSIEEIRDQYGLDRIIKLASNENALGVSPVVQEAIVRHASAAFRYARAASPRLRRKLGQALGVGPEQIVVGNGSDEIIDLLLRIVPQPGRDNVVLFRPSFNLYELQAKLCDVAIRRIDLNPDFSFPLHNVPEYVDGNTRLVFLTSPDNPSGYACPAADLDALAATLPPNCLLVVDQAYIDFCQPKERFDALALLARHPHIVVLRTFSKAYGLAGLRLGYGVMPRALADFLLRVKLPFSVNLLAEEAGLAALEDTVFLEQTILLCISERERVTKKLSGLGAVVLPSQANFVMFRPPVPAEWLFTELLRRGVIIRPLTAGYNLPDYLRVSIGTPEENSFFLGCCEEIFNA